MLKEAASSAKPTKYAQNKRHGMYEGTASIMNLAPERCSAPKTATGMAKHKLLKTTILSRPPARAMSVFAAHSATRKSTMPALHIETTGREISKNVARMVACMCMPGVSPRALARPESPFGVQKTVRSIHPPQRRFFGIKTRPASESNPSESVPLATGGNADECRNYPIWHNNSWPCPPRPPDPFLSGEFRRVQLFKG